MSRLLLVIAVLAACKDKEPPAGKASAPATSDACAKAKPHGPIAWIEDDYPAAVACAKAKQLPLVIDLWAPWCHTCLSMKSTVFADGSMAKEASRFVFVALDTDRETNAAAVAKYPLSAWPTFYVVAPDESVLARYVGAASLAQFQAFLDDGAKAVAGVDGAAKHLLAAERAIAAKDLATAETELVAAIAAAPAGWVRKPDALTTLIHTKRKRGDVPGCVDVAEKHLEDTGATASATDFLGIGLDCAGELPDKSRTAAFRERAIARLQQLLADPAAQLSADDRSDAMVYLRDVLDAVGRKPEAINLAEQQRIFLEQAIAKATSPLAAMTFNYQLAGAYIYLGRPLEAVPALEKSAAALPHEYDPAARLGWVYLEANKLPEAATWTDKAIKLAYGPRKAGLIARRADIAAKQGDLALEKKLRGDVVALWESLPPGHANPDALAKAKAALAKLDAPPAP